jgi:hypothetical protein
MKKFSTAEEYIRQFDVPVVDILRHLRNLIRRALPEATEYVEKDMLAYALGPNTYKASVCVISGHRAHVTLGFLRGSSLNDPDELLQGKEKTVRHLRLVAVDVIPNKVVSDWVKQAAQFASVNEVYHTGSGA